MPTKGITITEKERIKITQFLIQNNWQQINGENNPFLIGKYQLDNNIIKFFKSKKGITFYCNTEITIEHILQKQLIQRNATNKIIEIDDSGWGSPFLGVLIGFFFHPIEKLDFILVEPKYFQTPLFESHTYLNRTTELILQKFEEYHIDKEWHIEMCSGYIFEKARDSLRQIEYQLTSVQIRGILQNYVEAKFRDILTNEYHIPSNILGGITQSKQDYKISFYKMISYIEQHPEVLKYCKTGWNYFKKRERNMSEKRIED